MIFDGLGIACLIGFIVIGLQTFIRFCMGRSAEGFTTVILLIFIGGVIMVSLGLSDTIARGSSRRARAAPSISSAIEPAMRWKKVYRYD